MRDDLLLAMRAAEMPSVAGQHVSRLFVALTGRTPTPEEVAEARAVDDEDVEDLGIADLVDWKQWVAEW